MLSTDSVLNRHQQRDYRLKRQTQSKIVQKRQNQRDSEKTCTTDTNVLPTQEHNIMKEREPENS